MNTNNNLYTVIYTTLIVVVVAALLAFVSQSLKERQEANEKAETISQMLTAAGYGTKAELDRSGNAAKLDKYAGEIAEAFLIDAEGNRAGELNTDRKALQVFSPKELKRENYNIKGGANKTGDATLPVFKFKNGRTVVPIYGAGLWGPIWGYIAFEEDLKTIAGAYFDHESETAGLGARIKDDPAFQAAFIGETPDFSQPGVFEIVKGGAPKDAEGKSLIDNKIDAISGATMTSQGLEQAIDVWLAAYAPFFQGGAPEQSCCDKACCDKACCDSLCNRACCDSTCIKAHCDSACVKPACDSACVKPCGQMPCGHPCNHHHAEE